MKVAKVENHYSPDEFKKLFVKYKNDTTVYTRLMFIRSLLNGKRILQEFLILIGELVLNG